MESNEKVPESREAAFFPGTIHWVSDSRLLPGLTQLHPHKPSQRHFFFDEMQSSSLLHFRRQDLPKAAASSLFWGQPSRWSSSGTEVKRVLEYEFTRRAKLSPSEE